MALFPFSAAAHPADMYFQTQTLHLTPQGATLEWTLLPGPMLVPWVWSDADQDQDREVNQKEARAWVEKQLPQLGVALDGTPLTWQLKAIEWPDSQNDFQMGDQLITVHLETDWPQTLTEAHRLSLSNRYEDAISIYWFYLHGEEGITFQRPQQQNGLLEGTFNAAEVAQNEDALSYWDSGTPSLSTAGQAEDAPAISESLSGENASAILTDLVRQEESSLSFYLIALTIAAVLGALHALTPGHGKTVVAAYLVGSRGTTRHAVFLGSIVTLTHTGSVFLLGLVTLVASRYILPTSLFPILELVSGLLIVALGAYLLYQRWAAWRACPAEGAEWASRVETHSHHHHHSRHDHDHSHGHHHHDHSHSHDIPDPSELTWRSLLVLGVSGGLVPCPDAIAILLVAVAINRIGLGLSLIVSFSLGLALVLIVIGLAMVHSRRLFERMDAFSRLAPLMPVISALVVLALGLALTWGALRHTGLLWSSPDEATEALASSAYPAPASASFDPNNASVLYVDRDEADRHQVFTLRPGAESALLTTESFGVLDYALSPDGRTVAYTAQREHGGSEIWAIGVDGEDRRQLTDCSEAPCGRGVWSPDGERLVYERLAPPSANAASGLTTLWQLDATTGESGPVFQDSQLPGFNPRWSPDGQWLSYAWPGGAGVQIYHLSDGRSLSTPNQMGAPVIWRPDSSALLMSDVLRLEDRFVNHLMRFDLEKEELLDLTGAENLEDSAASWSPDGEQIAVVRRKLAEGASMGNQLWLMKADGSDARPLTNTPDAVHGAPVWSPDGRYLLFHRYPLKVSSVQSGIYWLNVETGEVREIVSSGSRPVWVGGQ